MIRLIRCAPSSTPRPAPSTPQLLETTVRSPAPCACSASMSTHGMPLKPNPPTASVAPEGTSARAWAASGTTLSMHVTVEHRPGAPLTTDGGSLLRGRAGMQARCVQGSGVDLPGPCHAAGSRDEPDAGAHSSGGDARWQPLKQG